MFQQFAGGAWVSLQWDAGVSGGPAQDLPWGQVFPFAPGSAAPVSVAVNGVPSVPACAAQVMGVTGGWSGNAGLGQMRVPHEIEPKMLKDS